MPTLNISYPINPAIPSSNTAFVMDHFGIDNQPHSQTIASELNIDLQNDDSIILFTGLSGSGKSSLMNSLSTQLENVLDLNSLSLPNIALIDALSLPPQQALSLLALCGLGEAHLMLRTPQELSEGQRYRFRLALAVSKQPTWILADEFAATLDRTLACVISANISRIAKNHNVRFLLATNHTDIIPDLQPQLTLHCTLNGTPEVLRQDQPTQKKSPSASTKISGFPQAPVPTGRTSLGGITARTISVTSAT